MVENALVHGHLEIARFLDINRIDNRKPGFVYNIGNVPIETPVEVLEWAYEAYKFKPEASWLKRVIIGGHIETVKWVLKRYPTLINNKIYLGTAIKNDQYAIYKLLSNRVEKVSNPAYYVASAFGSEKLEMLQLLVKEYPVFECHETIYVTAKTYHLMQWLCANDLWKNFCQVQYQ